MASTRKNRNKDNKGDCSSIERHSEDEMTFQTRNKKAAMNATKQTGSPKNPKKTDRGRALQKILEILITNAILIDK